ncbi:hypothetical protein ACOA56_001870 [Vibrio cholerae]
MAKNIYPYYSVILFEKTKLKPIDADGTATTILIVSAIEAFINDVAAFYESVAESECGISDNIRTGVIRTDDGEFLVMSEDERNLQTSLSELQKSTLRLGEKLLSFSSLLNSRKIKKGCHPYQDFETLLRVRNQLVHAESQPLTVDECKNIDISSYPRVVKNLLQNKTIPKRNVRNSWVYALDNEEYTTWCRTVFVDIVLGLLDEFSSEEISQLFKGNYLYALGVID